MFIFTKITSGVSGMPAIHLHGRDRFSQEAASSGTAFTCCLSGRRIALHAEAPKPAGRITANRQRGRKRAGMLSARQRYHPRILSACGQGTHVRSGKPLSTGTVPLHILTACENRLRITAVRSPAQTPEKSGNPWQKAAAIVFPKTKSFRIHTYYNQSILYCQEKTTNSAEIISRNLHKRRASQASALSQIQRKAMRKKG